MSLEITFMLICFPATCKLPWPRGFFRFGEREMRCAWWVSFALIISSPNEKFDTWSLLTVSETFWSICMLIIWAENRSVWTWFSKVSVSIHNNKVTGYIYPALSVSGDLYCIIYSANFYPMHVYDKFSPILAMK
jgi:hypothetical protein